MLPRLHCMHRTSSAPYLHKPRRFTCVAPLKLQSSMRPFLQTSSASRELLISMLPLLRAFSTPPELQTSTHKCTARTVSSNFMLAYEMCLHNCLAGQFSSLILARHSVCTITSTLPAEFQAKCAPTIPLQITAVTLMSKDLLQQFWVFCRKGSEGPKLKIPPQPSTHPFEYLI